MNYNEALQKLHEMYPDTLVSLKYERGIHPDGGNSSDSPEITAYAGPFGWGKAQSNFYDAINIFTREKDMDSGITESKEDE